MTHIAKHCVSLLILVVSLAIAGAAQAQSTLASTDIAPVSQADGLALTLGQGLGAAALQGRARQGRWAGGFVTAGTAVPETGQSGDFAGRGLTLGYGIDRWGVAPFIGYGQGQSDLSDGVTQARVRSYFYGLSFARDAGQFRYDGALFTGGTHTALSSPGTGIGSADYDGRLIGLSLRARGPLSGVSALDFALQGDVAYHQTEGHDFNGTLGFSVAPRKTMRASLRGEVGLKRQHGALTLRPFAALTVETGSYDALSLSDASGTAQLTAQALDRQRIGLGADFATSRLRGRLELDAAQDGDTRARLSLGLAF